MKMLINRNESCFGGCVVKNNSRKRYKIFIAIAAQASASAKA